MSDINDEAYLQAAIAKGIRNALLLGFVIGCICGATLGIAYHTYYVMLTR